jgi:hypothetical protein
MTLRPSQPFKDKRREVLQKGISVQLVVGYPIRPLEYQLIFLQHLNPFGSPSAMLSSLGERVSPPSCLVEPRQVKRTACYDPRTTLCTYITLQSLLFDLFLLMPLSPLLPTVERLCFFLQIIRREPHQSSESAEAALVLYFPTHHRSRRSGLTNAGSAGLGSAFA